MLAGVLGSLSGASASAIFLIPVTFYVIERLFAGRESNLAFFAPKHIAIPVAVTAFPNELYQAPRSWTEKAYPKLIHYNRVDKGGHFAAWEQPEILVTELRAAFKSLR